VLGDLTIAEQLAVKMRFASTHYTIGGLPEFGML
jgi:hypothetical protein